MQVGCHSWAKTIPHYTMICQQSCVRCYSINLTIAAEHPQSFSGINQISYYEIILQNDFSRSWKSTVPGKAEGYNVN